MPESESCYPFLRLINLLPTGYLIMKMAEKIIDYMAAILLLGVGFMSAVIGIADFVGWEPPFIPAKPPIQILLVTIGFLSLGVGLERVVRFRRYDEYLREYTQHLKQYDQHLERVEHILTQSMGGQFYMSYHEIYEVAKRLANTANSKIRDIIFGTGPKAPLDWVEAVARRLEGAKLAGTPIEFEVIIAIDLAQLPPNFLQINEERFQILKRHGVRDALSVYLLDLKPAIGFDLLIIDREHISLNLTPAGGKYTQRCVVFEHQPQLASSFADCFDQLIRQATPYEDWLRVQQMGKDDL